MAVRVEPKGPVTTVVLDRPEVRNAVDGPTAAALAEAFSDFDSDPDASVAVLFGEGGTFCAGADLKAIGSPDGNRTDPDGNAPMGPTRMRRSTPVIAASSGHARAGGRRARRGRGGVPVPRRGGSRRRPSLSPGWPGPGVSAGTRTKPCILTPGQDQRRAWPCLRRPGPSWIYLKATPAGC